ncbi:MAG: glycosyl hydrolase family 28-related protein, partial [Gammaproteobacteria bacterium]
MKTSLLPVTLLLVTGFASLSIHPAGFEHALQAAPLARINTPEQPRQDPNRPRLNVRDYGARGNGVQDDTRAIQAAINAAPATGAIIYFPAGTYISNNFQVTNKNGLTFEGDGFTSVIKRPPLPGNTRIATIENSNDMFFRNIAFDENGITHFGGINLYGVHRVRIENTRHFDSRPWSLAEGGGDHYSWLFQGFIAPGGGVIANEDITIVNNLIEDLTFEMNYVTRGLVEGNTMRRPYFGFGTFSAAFNAEVGGPGVQTEDLVVRNNTIVDPLGSAIAIHLDPGSDINSSFRRILIANNRIRMGRQV